MPPTSKTIFEEGAQVKSFKIVKAGDFQREELVRLLMDEPAKCVATNLLTTLRRSQRTDTRAALAVDA